MRPADRPAARLLRAYQDADPDDFVQTLAGAVSAIGGSDVVLFLVDYAHVALRPHPDPLPHATEPVVATLDGSMAGRAFTSSTVVASERDGSWQVWVPISERSNRLGVLAVTLPVWDDEIEALCVELGLAAAPLLIATGHYTDLPHRLRRIKHLGLAAELQWSLLPPLSFASANLTVSGLLEPAYEVGGDSFDYAFNAGVLEFAMLDTMGHGLTSAVLAGLLVGAYRHGRRHHDDFAQLATRIDGAARAFPRESAAFATGILGRLDSATGRLTWMSCGHVLPLVVRGGSTLADPPNHPGVPFGMGALAPVIGDLVEIQLEPGDGVLIYTDGVTEARTPDGEFFGEERLRDLLAREHVAGDSPHEVVRRLVRTSLEHSGSVLRDDASLLYLRWSGPLQA